MPRARHDKFKGALICDVDRDVDAQPDDARLVLQRWRLSEEQISEIMDNKLDEASDSEQI